MPDNISTLQQSLTKALDHVKNDISTLRTGKANTALLDPIAVEVYGSKMKINELANVSVPDANMLIISPWDKSILADIEAAIQKSGLNLNPVVDGDRIRIVVPALTQERREEMVKILHQKIESGRVMLRSARTDAKKIIENQKGKTGISEDDIKFELEEMEKTVKEYTTKLDNMATAKEKELMTI